MKRRFQVRYADGSPQVVFEADWYEWQGGAVAFLLNTEQAAPFLVVMLPAGSWSSICEIC